MDLDSLDHERYVERALELAREAADRGDEPFGSLLVLDSEIVAEARNAVNTADDIRRHPELELARRAASELDPAERERTVLYTSTEPCPMCSGGIAIAGLGAVVYSVSAERVVAFTGGDPAVRAAEIFERRGDDVAVVGPVLPAAGDRVHEAYWG